MKVNEYYPKVLIINSQSMLEDNATGITLRSLWADWPKEKLLEIYEDEKKQCMEEFRINRVKIPDRDFLFKKIMHRSIANNVNSSLKKGSYRADNKKSNTLKSKIRQSFVCLWNMSPVKIDNATMQIIEEFSPDVIYTIGGSVTILHICYSISKMKNLHVVVHYMDNWPEHLQWENNAFLYPYKLKLHTSLRRVMKRSTIGIAISDAMAERYNEIFRMNHSVLMNSVNANDYLVKEKNKAGKTVFVYAGGLHLNRWKALKEIAECINCENGVFKIYTSEENRKNYECAFENLPVEFCKMVPHDQIIDVYEKADVLIHTETNDPLMQGFFKYSISTKIPEYLATGRLVLFYGPKELGLYRYLNENHVAVCASDHSELQDAINRICTNGIDDNIDNIKKRAYMLVKKNHDINVTREVLRKTMLSGV